MAHSSPITNQGRYTAVPSAQNQSGDLLSLQNRLFVTVDWSKPDRSLVRLFAPLCGLRGPVDCLEGCVTELSQKICPNIICSELVSLLIFTPCCTESLPSWLWVCSPSLRVCVRTGVLCTSIPLSREPPRT